MWSVWQTWKMARRPAGFFGGLLVAILLAAAPAVAALLEDSSPVTLSNGDSGGAFSPQVVVTSGGRVYVAWIDGHDILFKRFGATSGSCGGPGGLEFELVRVLPGVTGTPSTVAMAGNDSGVFVAWRAGTEIWFSRSTDGGQSFVGEPSVLSRNASNLSEPSVAADSGGGVYVAWEENASAASHPAVQIAQFTDRGMTLRPTGTVFATEFGFSYQPSVASTGSAAVHVVWSALNELGSRAILHKKFAPGDDPAGASFTPLTGEFALSPMNPRIAAHGNQVTAAWIEGGNIKARTMTDGQAFGDEAPVYSSQNSVFGLTLNVGGAGRFAAWPEVQFDPSFAVSLPYALGNRVGRLPSGGTDAFPWAPSVGQDGTALFVAAWQEFGTDSDGSPASQVKFAHTGGSGSSTPMQANAYVRQPRESILSGARAAGGQGRVNVYIELGDGSPGSISARDIDPATLTLNGKGRLPGLTRLGYINSNRILDLEVQFPQSAFAGEGYYTVEGKTKGGCSFSYTNTVKPKVKVDVKVKVKR